jgi:hypothetical protein
MSSKTPTLCVGSESAIRPTIHCFLFVRLLVRINFWEFILTDCILGFTRSLQSNLKCCPTSENALWGHQNVENPQPTFSFVAIYWDELQILVMERKRTGSAVLSIRHDPSPRDLFVCPHIQAAPKYRSAYFCSGGGMLHRIGHLDNLQYQHILQNAMLPSVRMLNLYCTRVYQTVPRLDLWARMYLLDLSLGSMAFNIVPLCSDTSIPASLPLLELVMDILFSKRTKNIL